jgi:hypothetical protein
MVQLWRFNITFSTRIVYVVQWTSPASTSKILPGRTYVALSALAVALPALG